MPWDDGLRGAAREIAGTDRSPLRVVAGPGTGKTYALMRRVARLLEEGVDPNRILLVTFTRVAARDLDRELTRLRSPGVDRVQKGTLHSFCFSTLHRANVLGLIGRVPRPMLKFEERFLLEDIREAEFGNVHQREKSLKALGAAWAREQDQAPGWPQSEIDRRFRWRVDGWLRFHQALLLDELVPVTLSYVRDNPGCSERRQFDHVLVDEYQDLNVAEQRLVDLLSERSSLAVVGDEDQSIYESLRYARPEGISTFDQSHANTHDIPLHISRRCPRRIAAMANQLIQNNISRTGRVLLVQPGNPDGDVHVVQWSNMENEAIGIAQFICDKIVGGEFARGETLVLCPRRQFGYMIRDALQERRCPAQSFFHEELLKGNPKTLEDCQAQQAFALLTLLANPQDRVAMRCWLGFGSQTLRRPGYGRLSDYCARNGPPRLALDQMLEGALSLPHMRHITDRYSQLVDSIGPLAAASAEDIVDALFPESEPWTQPFRAIVDEWVDDWTVQGVFDTLRRSITQPELPTDVDYVRVMSLHKAKGLNADHVVVTGCVEGLIPTRDETLSHQEAVRFIEEQRRLFYVAITRPRQTLVLSSVRELPRALAYKMGAKVQGGDRETAETISSSFFSELGPECPQPVFEDEWVY